MDHLLLPPDIRTERLVLKPISAEWTQDMFREFTPEITTYMFPTAPQKIEETKEFVLSSIEKMKQGKELVFVILDSDGKEFFGCVGLHKMNTARPELGIWLKKSAHGKKLGREAVTGVKEWADAHLEYDYIVYPVDKDNIASRKIPESLGAIMHAEYDKETLRGHVLHIVEYRIYFPA